MKTIRNKSLPFALFAIVAVALFGTLRIFAQETPPGAEPVKIRNIEVNFTGLSNVNEEVVRANMALREGEEFDQIAIDRDIRSLYRTRLFEFIEVRLRPVDDSSVDVIFDIRPKFRISSISFEGNKAVRDRRLEREITVEVNQVLNERLVNDDSEALKEMYLKRGYSQVRIDYSIDRNPGTGYGNVVFKISEGRKFKIGKLKFAGNEDLGSGKLKRNIKTKKWSWLSVFTGSGKFDSDQFEDDLEALRDLYRKEGYLDVDIDPAKVQFSYPSKSRMKIDINVDEGRQYRVGEIDFEGNELYKSNLLTFLLHVKAGDVYRPEKLDEDVSLLEDFYAQFGYMETRVRMRRIPNVTTGDIDLIFQIYESEKFQVESIDIEGNSKTKSTVVIRELALTPGSTFDGVRMESSRMRLENTRFFEDVNVAPQSTNIPNRKDLRVTFQEGRTGNFSFGAGFSSLEKGTFFIELTQSNFDILNWRGAFQGDGQKFRLKAQLGSVSSQIVLAFEEPWLFERRLSFGFNIFDSATDYDNNNYDSEQVGFDIYLRKRLIELVNATITYGYKDVSFNSTSDSTSEELLRSGEGVVSSLNLLLRRDTRDRIINTFKGMRLDLDLTSAGGFLGGDHSFYKIESRNAFYLPISRWHTQTIEILARTGMVEETGDSVDVPWDERFFLGGPNTIRGFEFREVGPMIGIGTTDDGSGPQPSTTGSYIGGKTYGLLSIEYSMGITDGFRIAAFYDGGFVNRDAGDFSLDRKLRFIPKRDPFDLNEFNVDTPDLNEHLSFDSYTFDNSGWNDNYGIGIRISMMGTPLRLDYAIPLDSDPFNDEGAQFNFSFGGRF